MDRLYFINLVNHNLNQQKQLHDFRRIDEKVHAPDLLVFYQMSLSQNYLTVRCAHGFGTGSCVFSGFQPCKNANFTVAFPKTEVLGKPQMMRY
jgi:hypothetical protein